MSSRAVLDADAPEQAVRERQMALGAWILGWIGGPIPGAAMLFVLGRESWARRHVAVAVAFWAALAVVWAGVVVTVEAPAQAWVWIGLAIVAVVGTASGAIAALRRSKQHIAALERRLGQPVDGTQAV